MKPLTSPLRTTVALGLAVALVHVALIEWMLHGQTLVSRLQPLEAPQLTRTLGLDAAEGQGTVDPTANASGLGMPQSTVGQRIQARSLHIAPLDPQTVAITPPPRNDPPQPRTTAESEAKSPSALTRVGLPIEPPESAADKPPALPQTETHPAERQLEAPAPTVHTGPTETQSTAITADRNIEKPAERTGLPSPATAQESWKNWPPSTRLSYRLTGYFRGDLHGSARVEWRRQGDRYQAQVAVDVALFVNMTFTSQGRIQEARLWPETYEEERRGKRRGNRFGEQWVTLDNGSQVPRPSDLQDTASQFVQLAQDFRTGRMPMGAGQEVPVVLARPGGVDRWVYDLHPGATVETALGVVDAVHLKPRPLPQARGTVTAEMWFAPRLQHLPVRIRLHLNPETWLDLVLEQVQQAE